MMISATMLVGSWILCDRRTLTIDGTHDESDLSGVCGTREVGIDLFRLGLVQ